MFRSFRSPSAIAVCAFATCGLVSPALARGGTDLLRSFRDRARPVIVLSDSRDDPRVARQIQALDHARSDLDQRNVEIMREAKPGSALRKSLGVGVMGFAVVLVGKDGSVKKIWRDPVEPRRIFELIDSMPMRQKEMTG